MRLAWLYPEIVEETMKQLSENDVQLLRQRGLLKATEIAFELGGTILAEDIETKARRQIDAVGLMLEAHRQLLND